MAALRQEWVASPAPINCIALGSSIILDPKFMNAADRHTISQVKPVFREARLPSTATLRAATSDPRVWTRRLRSLLVGKE